MPYYVYRQSVNGGGNLHSSHFADYVCIEAANATEANAMAGIVGLYFGDIPFGNTDETGWHDCDSCEDRWSPADEPGYDTYIAALASIAPQYYRDSRIVVAYHSCRCRTYASTDTLPCRWVASIEATWNSVGESFHEAYESAFDVLSWLTSEQLEQRMHDANKRIVNAREYIADDALEYELAEEDTPEYAENMRDIAAATATIAALSTALEAKKVAVPVCTRDHRCM